MKEALLLIDIQNDYFEGGKSELSNPLIALENAEKILNRFRSKGEPVIHVHHINTGSGATFFLPNTEGVEIHKKLAPLQNEFIVTKHVPNSFFETNLGQIVKDENITNFVICGMMSHMCIDTTVRACKDYKLDVTLIEDACTTKNLKYREETISAEIVHKTFMAALNGMFAKVVSAEHYLKNKQSL